MTKPTSVLRSNGKYAYTVERPEQVEELPFYYLVQLQEQTHFTQPHKAVSSWYCGPFTVFGR